MLAITLGAAALLVAAITAAALDPLGWGFLPPSQVEAVARARLAEPLLGMPPLYFLAAALLGAGASLLVRHPLGVRFALGLDAATLLLLLAWDARRRRGTMAVYLRLRREDLGTAPPRGEVIETPQLMTLVLGGAGLAGRRATSDAAWARLAARLRRASRLSGARLTEYLEASLDVDPEVLLLRHAADSMVARVLLRARR